jgi:hypothetical protein
VAKKTAKRQKNVSVAASMQLGQNDSSHVRSSSNSDVTRVGGEKSRGEPRWKVQGLV